MITREEHSKAVMRDTERVKVGERKEERDRESDKGGN